MLQHAGPPGRERQDDAILRILTNDCHPPRHHPHPLRVMISTSKAFSHSLSRGEDFSGFNEIKNRHFTYKGGTIMLDKALLADMSFFSGLDLEDLAAIARAGDILEFDANGIIFKEGETAEDLFGILQGEVELSLMFEENRLETNIQYEESILARIQVLQEPIVFDTLDPGEIFGWSSLVGPGQLTSTARCVRPTRVFAVPAPRLKAILDKNPQAGYLLMERLGGICFLCIQ